MKRDTIEDTYPLPGMDEIAEGTGHPHSTVSNLKEPISKFSLCKLTSLMQHYKVRIHCFTSGSLVGLKDAVAGFPQ